MGCLPAALLEVLGGKRGTRFTCQSRRGTHSDSEEVAIARDAEMKSGLDLQSSPTFWKSHYAAHVPGTVADAFHHAGNLRREICGGTEGRGAQRGVGVDDGFIRCRGEVNISTDGGAILDEKKNLILKLGLGMDFRPQSLAGCNRVFGFGDSGRSSDVFLWGFSTVTVAPGEESTSESRRGSPVWSFVF